MDDSSGAGAVVLLLIVLLFSGGLGGHQGPTHRDATTARCTLDAIHASPNAADEPISAGTSLQRDQGTVLCMRGQGLLYEPQDKECSGAAPPITGGSWTATPECYVGADWFSGAWRWTVAQWQRLSTQVGHPEQQRPNA